MHPQPVEVGTSYIRRDHGDRVYVVKVTWGLFWRELRPLAVEVSARTGVDPSMLRSLRLGSIIDEWGPRMVKLYGSHLERAELSIAERSLVRDVLAAGREPAPSPGGMLTECSRTPPNPAERPNGSSLAGVAKQQVRPYGAVPARTVANGPERS